MKYHLEVELVFDFVETSFLSLVALVYPPSCALFSNQQAWGINQVQPENEEAKKITRKGYDHIYVYIFFSEKEIRTTPLS